MAKDNEIKECDVCEHLFDLAYVVDAWDNILKKYICDLCRRDDDG